jgi:hypothetical protein
MYKSNQKERKRKKRKNLRGLLPMLSNTQVNALVDPKMVISTLLRGRGKKRRQ